MDDKRLDHLLTYTTFHIGVYVSLGAAIIGATELGKLQVDFFLKSAVVCLLFAGLCGGVIGSTIPNHIDFESLTKDRIGFWKLKILRVRWWAHLEHSAFWLAVVLLVAPFFWPKLKGWPD